MAPKLSLTPLTHWVTAPDTIAAFKGTLSYLLVFLLIFISKAEKFVDYPIAFVSAIVVTISGFPGKSIGSCLLSLVLALAGIFVGCLNFYILAKLAHYPVAQGFVFAFMLYIFALIKSIGMMYFGFSLLCILVSFNGIYTSLLLGGEFSVKYLTSYLYAYLWGGAIVVFVNLFIFPKTSERELRQTLDLSLEHIRVFCHLLAKTYNLTITEEEIKIRDELNASIRADYSVLRSKLAESAIEVNWSKWSLDDYRCMVAKTRDMQISLLAIWTSLNGVENQDIEYFRKRFLASALLNFGQLRRDLHITISEIRSELGVGNTVTTRQQEDLEDLDRWLENSIPLGRSESPSVVTSEGKEVSQGRRQTQGSTDDGTRMARRGTVLSLSGISLRERRKALNSLTTRLAAEVGAPDDDDEQSESTSPTQIETESELEKGVSSGERDTEEPKDLCKGDKLKMGWETFEKLTYDIIGNALASGELVGQHQELLVETPLPSLKDLWGTDLIDEANDQPSALDDFIKGHRQKKIAREGGRSNSFSMREPMPSMLPRRRGTMASTTTMKSSGESFKGPATEIKPEGTSDDTKESQRRQSIRSEIRRRETMIEVIDQTLETEADEAENSHHSLVRVYSWLFAMHQFVAALYSMNELTNGKISKSGEKRTKRLHFHIWESLAGDDGTVLKEERKEEGRPGKGATKQEKEEAKDISIREALCLLEGREFKPEKITIFHRYRTFETFIRGSRSIYALKATAAVIIYALLYWSTVTRAWFTSYTLTGGLLTVIVALSPTLGQSFITFVFQISGQAVGLVAGLVICYIFKDVGGYRYNPYGMLPLIALYAFPLQYIIYTKPQFFVLPFLALNSCGVIVATEYTYRHVPGFDEPYVRLYKGLTSLSIALGIVAFFQLAVFRNPARRTLRKALAKITYQNLSYNTILSAYVRANLSADSQFTPDSKANDRVYHELVRREKKIQAAIADIGPLLKFAQSEPSFTRPFSAKNWIRISRANQVILDRQRDGRLAVGLGPTDDIISTNFISVLSPYRRRNTRLLRGAFYAITTSLTSKIPLPSELPKTREVLPAFIHDALVLSSQIAKTEEGRDLVRSHEFTRYWFYLLSSTSVGFQLEEIEDALKAIYGKLEDDPNLD